MAESLTTRHEHQTGGEVIQTHFVGWECGCYCGMSVLAQTEAEANAWMAAHARHRQEALDATEPA